MPVTDTDDTLFSKVDVTNILTREGKAPFGPDIKRKDRPNERFSIYSPPMVFTRPMLTGEGDLGTEFPTTSGDKQVVVDRTKANFKAGLAIGDLGDEFIRASFPGLKGDQRLFAKRIREAGSVILGQVFDLRPKDFAKKISEIEADVIENKAKVLKAEGREGVKEANDVLRLMATDAELQREVTNEARAKFIEKAKYHLPDPDKFDADGNCPREDGSVARLIINIKRKVYTREDEHRTKTAKEMQAKAFSMSSASDLPPTSGMGQTAGSPYPAILRDVAGKYRWNPFHYVTASGPMTHPYITYVEEPGKKLVVRKALDTEIPKEDPKTYRRPYMVASTDDKGVVTTTALDPDWDPIPGRNKRTLASLRVTFSVFNMQGEHGVKIVPDGALKIFYQTEQAEYEAPKDSYSDAAAMVAAYQAKQAAAAAAASTGAADTKKRTADEAGLSNDGPDAGDGDCQDE